jgi:ribosome biogenesis GTPase A
MKRPKNLPPEVELTPDTDPKKLFNWYPGHMVRAIREIKEKLKHVDIVLEVRDARVPLASSNKAMEEVFRQKSRLILLNKVNLADPNSIMKWETWFKSQDVPFMFINCFEKTTLKKVMTYAQKIVDEKRRESNPDLVESKEKLKLMVIGLPNTGKSTLINQLANRNATKVADRPGQTVGQQWINIDKNLDLLDTPGIMPPELEQEDHALWLSAINAIPDGVMGEEMPAIFLIKYFLEKNSKEFLARYKLEGNETDIDDIIKKIAVTRGCIKQKGLPDLDRVYKLILLDFRNGELGKSCFGFPPA